MSAALKFLLGCSRPEEIGAAARGRRHAVRAQHQVEQLGDLGIEDVRTEVRHVDYRLEGST
jgi:hypothetical protein